MAPAFRDRFEDLLDQLELVRGERIRVHEIDRAAERSERHPAVAERKLVLEDVALCDVNGLKVGLDLGRLGEQTLPDHLVDVGAGERQRREEAALDLREVLPLRLRHVAEDGVHVLLRRHDHPRPPPAVGSQFLDDRLQAEHQMGVGPDELADLVDQEGDPVLRALRVEVFLDPFAEVLDRDRELVLGAVEPAPAGRLALAERLAQRLDDLVLAEMVGVALRAPGQACALRISSFEGGQPSLAVEIALHVRDVRVVAAVTLQLVENLEEHPEDDVPPVAAAVRRLRIDIEEDDIGIGGDGALDVAEQNSVLDLAFEELDGELGLAVLAVGLVREEVGDDLQEVRLAGAEEPGNPNAHLAAGVGRLSGIDRFEIPGDELAEVQVQLPRHDEFVKLLPHRGIRRADRPSPLR